MIRILDKSKTLPQLVEDTSGGIGSLDVFDATVTEELNGIYEAEFKVLCSEKYYSELEVDSILKLPVNEAGDEQLFRVYYISPAINGVVQVKLQHITYDLSKVVVEPFTATGAVAAKNLMLSHVMGTYPFDMTTDILNNSSTFKLEIPRSFRECLGGYEGSLLDVFRGEYEWDNLTVKMLARRGSDNNVRIAYGKNLTDFKQETNNESVYSAVLGYAVVNDVTYYGSIYHKIVMAYPKVKIVDFSSDYEMDDVPTAQELTAKAQSYAENNNIEIPKVNITVSFVPLYQTEEYKNIAPLERVRLGDTVHVSFDKLGVEASSRVVKTVWNINAGRYDSVELGNTKASLNSVIDDSIDQAKSDIMKSIEDTDVGFLEEELDEMSSLIINGLGLHKTVDSLGRIYLHNEETLAASQYQYVITAQGFMMSDDYGQTWNSGWDTSGNAILNALSTITLNALEIYGSYIQGSQIVFGDPLDQNGKYIIAQPYSNGVTFDGTGTIRLQPQEAFYIYNRTSDGNNNYNGFYMSKKGSYSNNYIELLNYDETQSFLLANFIEMDAHFTYNNSVYNRTVIRNYATATGTRYGGNYISLNAYADTTRLFEYNYKPTSTDEFANSMIFNAYDTTSSKYNSIGINNYSYNDNLLANQISFYASETMSYINMQNNEFDGSKIINNIRLSTNANGSRLELANGRVDLSSTSYTQVNRLTMISDTSGNSVDLFNLDSNGNVMNRLRMKSDATTELWSSNTITIHGAGRVDINSSGSQDLRLISADDIHLNPVGFIEVNGIYIYFSGGYVRYTTDRNTAISNKGY